MAKIKGKQLSLTDDQFEILDDADPTKILDLQLGSITTATTRTLTVQDQDGIISVQADATLTQGSIPFGDATGKLAQDNSNLFWDNTDNRLGVGIAAPVATLESAGGFGANVTTIAFGDSPYTVDADVNHTILANATGGSITINLPAAANNEHVILNIKKTDSSTNTITIDGNASETIDGATTYVIAEENESVTIHCDGSNWSIVDSHLIGNATVETAGGTYTSLATALSTEDEGQTILVGEGTFNETSSIEPKTGQVICGSGMDRTIIEVDSTEVLFPSESIAGAGTISISGSTVTGVGANLLTFAVGDLITYNGGLYTLAGITTNDAATIEEHVGNSSGALSPWFGLDISDMVYDVTIKDLTFKAISSAFGWMLRMDTTWRTKFKRVKFDGDFTITQGLFRAIGCVDVVFEDCVFMRSDARGMRHEDRNQNMTFRNCQFISNGTGANDWDHEILRSTQYKFERCSFIGGGDSAIKSFTTPIDGLKIINCEFKNKGDHPIEIDTASTDIGMLVQGCTFRDNAGSSVYINQGGNVRIVGNYIDNPAADGVQIDNDANNVRIVVNNNVIENATIGIDNDSTTAEILTAVGNDLSNSTTGIADAGSGNNVTANLLP